MTIRNYQGSVFYAARSTSALTPLRIYLAAVATAVSVVPPNSLLNVYQSAVVTAVRNYEVVRIVKKYPIIMLQGICGCYPVPFFKYEGS